MRFVPRLLFLLPVLPFALAGCQDPLPSRALVDDLRVLGVRADPPEARPGDFVGFDALVADPAGAGRPLRRAWAICNPGDGGVGSCGDPANVSVLGTDLRAGWTVPADVLDDMPEDERDVGKDVYVVFGVEAEGATAGEKPHDVAFKRVRISTSADPNRNPALARFVVDGVPHSFSEPLVLEAGREVSLEAEAAEVETWSGGVEDARFTWLVSAGAVADAVTYAEASGVVTNDWKLPADPKENPNAWVWVVLRDGRGGIAWAVQPVVFD